jgi:hypothetical protein
LPNQEVTKGEGAAPIKPPSPPSAGSSDSADKKRGGKSWGELTVAGLVILIIGWSLAQNLMFYGEIGKLRDRVTTLEQKNFVLKSELPQSTIAKEDWTKLTSTFASKEDLAQIDIKMKTMIYQLGVWAQDDFAEICEAGQGIPTSDNVCKLNGPQRQIVFKPLNLELRK